MLINFLLWICDTAICPRPFLFLLYFSLESCNDGLQNQGEDEIDCGGPCDACQTCSDGIQNQGEADIDCGGPCSACRKETILIQ